MGQTKIEMWAGNKTRHKRKVRMNFFLHNHYRSANLYMPIARNRVRGYNTFEGNII